MIKINYNKRILLDVKANEFFETINPQLKKPIGNRKYKDSSISQRLESKYSYYKSSTNYKYKVYEYLKNNIEEIIKGEPHVLEKHINIFKKILKHYDIQIYRYDLKSKDYTLNDFGEEILNVFNYDSFSKSEKAYKLVLALGINVCPYCNRQFINTCLSNSGKTRPTLDHFYEKGRFPYLSLSFFNLIPSCYSCNSSLKGKKKFKISTHVHPYIEGFENKLSFTIGFIKDKGDSSKYIVEYYKDNESFEIHFEENTACSIDDLERAKRNVECFKLKELYNFHKDYILELLQKSVIYNKEYISSITKSFPSIFNNEYSPQRMILGTSNLLEDFDKRPLSKLISDISNEIGLIEKIG